MRKTKIVCTLGPAIDDYNVLKEAFLSGLNCARLNFSHGTHEEQKVRIDNIKKLNKELGLNVPILLDTKGPEIRVRDFENKSVILQKGQEFTLSSDFDLIGNEHICGLTYPDLSLYVKEGDKILIDDGKIGLVVKRIEGRDIVTEVLNPGKVSNHKSINIPNVIVDMPYISETDRKDILFGVKQDVDFIAASFVRRKQDLLDLRKLLDENGGSGIKIIAKIENTEGVQNLLDIVQTADGVMVARGDLGVEVAYKKLPSIQKEMISACYKNGKIVITATQMLDSMQQNPRPTRAEVSDVANAVYDQTTCTMLSGETAAGQYPIEAINAMSDIATFAEEDINYMQRFTNKHLDLGHETVSVVANAAVLASYQTNAKAIICVTMHGQTAQMISSYRPSCPIIAITVDPKACRQLNIAWNVLPVLAEKKNSTDELFLYAIEKAKETGLVKTGDNVIITTGSSVGSGITDTMKLHTI
ncbi:MAG: pyruvate kinase [Anaeroplasmataceae bacterium]